MATRFQYNTPVSEDYSATKFYGDLMAAQQFTVSTAHSIEYVVLRMYRQGSPGNVIVKIQEVDDNEHPDGTVLCSGTVNANAFTTDNQGEWYQVDFSTSADLEENTMYAITVNVEDFAGNSSNAAYWNLLSPSTYSDGHGIRSVNQGSTWTDDEDEDYLFEEWGTEITAAGAMTLNTGFWGQVV